MLCCSLNLVPFWESDGVEDIPGDRILLFHCRLTYLIWFLSEIRNTVAWFERNNRRCKVN